jgi:hypothetical protein
LGWGEQWGGWNWRLKKYVEALKLFDPKKIIVIIDSYDVIASTTKQCNDYNDLIQQLFKLFNKDIVVSCEWYCGNSKNCGKVDEWWKHHKIKKAHKSNINAGCIVGYCGELLKAYKWILKNNFQDDQLGLSKYVELFPQKFGLDYGSSIFYTSHILDGIQIPKGTNSLFYHFPGPLLKLGLMPSYNSAAFKHIGFYARKLYPSIFLEFFLGFSCIIIILLTCIKIKNK